MRYKTITYTSLAALDLDERQIVEIHQEARDLNGLEGITGILIFNGTHFLQIVEGPSMAVDDLIDRLRRDERHSGVEVRDERMTDKRLFDHWSMAFVRVQGRAVRSREDLLSGLPEQLPPETRERIAAMAEDMLAKVEI